MLYVGMDVHLRQTDFCVRDDNGRKVWSRHVRGSPAEAVKELSRLQEPFSVCFEATTGYGPVFEGLSRIAHTVKVAHPGHLRLIFRSRRKSDRIDADKLSKLLYLGEVPEVYVPKSDVQAWRSMIRHRDGLVRERTRAKNQVRALLQGRGIKAPKGLWTKAGLLWLGKVELKEEFDALRLQELIVRHAYLDMQVKQVTKALDKRGRLHPGVQLLMTIPGVGPRTAEAVVAWIDDIRRFSRVQKVGSYFGIVPCLDSSAGAERYGHITREGPSVVRKLLVEAAWQGIKRSARVKGFFERIQRGDAGRKKIAIVATAHYLVRAMAAMLRTGETWREEVNC